MIYILDNDPKLCAQYLDDKSLNTMIKDITQVLCNVHWDELLSDQGLGNLSSLIQYGNTRIPIPSKHSYYLTKWAQWAGECRANYLYLVELGTAVGNELIHRLGHKEKIFALCIQQIPLIIPKKYIQYMLTPFSHLSEPRPLRQTSYRNYYQSKLGTLHKMSGNIYLTTKGLNVQWTNRSRPKWLRL